MKLKPAILFCLILLSFFGCRKPEKQVLESKKVHEINIGTGFSWQVVNGKKIYGFKKFFKFDLLRDSFYIKRNSTFIDQSGHIEIRGGKFKFKTDTLTLEFINAAQKTKN